MNLKESIPNRVKELATKRVMDSTPVKVAKRLERIFKPVTSEYQHDFAQVLAHVPEGEAKTHLENTIKAAMPHIKAENRRVVISSFWKAAVGVGVWGTLGAATGLAILTPHITSPIAPALSFLAGEVAGSAVGLKPESPAQLQRKAIAQKFAIHADSLIDVASNPSNKSDTASRIDTIVSRILAA